MVHSSNAKDRCQDNARTKEDMNHSPMTLTLIGQKNLKCRGHTTMRFFSSLLKRWYCHMAIKVITARIITA